MKPPKPYYCVDAVLSNGQVFYRLLHCSIYRGNVCIDIYENKADAEREMERLDRR